MRIAIIRRKFNPFGGAERFILRNIEGLQDKNIDIAVIAEEWNNQTSEINQKFEFIPIKVNSSNRVTRNKSFRQAVRNELHHQKFDITQSHERIAGVDICRLGDGLHASWVERLASVRPWYQRWWLKVDLFHRDIIAEERKMVCDQNLTFVANSPMVYDEMRIRYHIPQERLILIENGIDYSKYGASSATDKMSWRTQLSIKQYLTTILYIGSGFERKGAFELVRAMQYLPNHQLLVVGSDKKIKHLERLSRSLDLSHRVHILGPKNDVLPYLKAADIFCLPSLYDSLPNALLEGLASGLPAVITADVGIAHKLVSHGAGVITTRDPHHIAKTIIQVSDQLSTMSRQALHFVQEYDLQKKSQEWLKLYQSILSKKAQQRAHTTY